MWCQPQTDSQWRSLVIVHDRGVLHLRRTEVCVHEARPMRSSCPRVRSTALTHIDTPGFGDLPTSFKVIGPCKEDELPNGPSPGRLSPSMGMWVSGARQLTVKLGVAHTHLLSMNRMQFLLGQLPVHLGLGRQFGQYVSWVSTRALSRQHIAEAGDRL